MTSNYIAKSKVPSAVIILALFLVTSIALLMHLVDAEVSGFDWSLGAIEELSMSFGYLLLPLGITALYSTTMLLIIAKEQSALKDSIQHRSEIDTVPEQAENDPAMPVVDGAIPELTDVSVVTDNIVVQQEQKLIGDLKEKVRSTEQQLELAQAVKSQFLANMSHELRTPMNGILGMNELLLGSGLNDKQNRFADSVRRSAESLLGIINDLLDYSRMESGSLLLEKATFNIKELVEDVCDLHAEYAQSKDLELICHLDRSMHESVSGDSNRIRQLLTNLIGNAIKFTKQGEVVVRVRQLEEEKDKLVYRFDVVDTGVGISPEGQATIFESFTQADESFAREFGGAGLGLFITHKLVSMMDGKIELRSRMGEGSHFTVDLCLTRAESAEESGSVRISLEGLKVLIVDDNETNRTILYHQLKSWGVKPEAVESGEDAIRLLSEAVDDGEPYDVAILDLHMPVMDGLELTALIQENKKIQNVKRMMLTSAVLELDMEHLHKIGIAQYISKPARQAQLFSVLSDLAPGNIANAGKQKRKGLEDIFTALELKVLLAEDNLINQEVAENMLRNFGCRTDVVSTGRAALEICATEKFDIILMDCQMPVMDGLEATRRLRANTGLNQMTPVIALTANVLSGDKEKCLKSGMDGYIGKPVKQEELYTVVSQISEGFQEGTHTSYEATGSQSNAPTSNVLPLMIDEKSQSVAKTSIGQVKMNEKDDANKQTIGSNQASRDNATDKDGDIINMAGIEAIRKLQRPGKPDLVSKIIHVYLDKSPEIVSAIVVGTKEGNIVSVKEAAHSMKSSSAYVGADALSEKFKSIEHAANNDNISELEELVDNLEAKYNEVATILSQYAVKAA